MKKFLKTDPVLCLGQPGKIGYDGLNATVQVTDNVR